MKDDLLFRQLFDYETWTYTYLLADRKSGEAVLIDPVKEKAGRDLALLSELNVKLKFLLETHVHADHVTGAARLREATGAKTGVSKAAGVAAADLALEDGQALPFGPFQLRVIATPGHTDSCLSFSCAGMVFTGDTLLVRDVGRTDFQQGSSEKLFHSIRGKLFRLPPETFVYPGHDYNGFTVSTIGEERECNEKIAMKFSFADFQAKMAAMKLGPPKRIDIAVPANLRGGADS
jgi:glyoxylase-like metal-dependent hydrolase (beta-lactamase superfamily II)